VLIVGSEAADSLLNRDDVAETTCTVQDNIRSNAIRAGTYLGTDRINDVYLDPLCYG